MSAILSADVSAPVLLVHGLDDRQAATSPMQSVLMHDALVRLGKKARLVLLPNEGHSYRSSRAIDHVLAETLEWLLLHT